MKKRLFFLFIICSGLFFNSCEDTTEKDSTVKSFPFMQVGNSWIYKISIDGNDFPYDITYSIKSIDDMGYFTIEFLAGSTTNSDMVWYANSDFFSDESGAVEDFWFPILYKNNQIGKKWTSPEEDEEGNGTITREILSVSEDVKVIAGTFTNCVKIKETFSNDINIVNFYFISLKYGIIKKETTGWGDINNQPRIYFPIVVELKSKNF